MYRRKPRKIFVWVCEPVVESVFSAIRSKFASYWTKAFRPIFFVLLEITLGIFFIIKPTRCTNSTNIFWHAILHVWDSSSVRHQQFIHCTLSSGVSYRFADSFRTGPGLLLSVQWINSWWWTDELSETCRVSCQNKFVKLLHLYGVIIKKSVTMHGHMNVKNPSEYWKLYWEHLTYFVL